MADNRRQRMTVKERRTLVLIGVATGAMFAIGKGALRTQTLPSDADREIWTDFLDRQEKELSRNTVYVVCIAAAAALYFILGLSGAIPDLGAWVWIGSALLAGTAVFSVFEARSRRARINALRAQLGPDTAARP